MPPNLRVGVYIPTHYNPNEDGERKTIESRKHRQVKEWIIKKFGAISMHGMIQGVWVHQKTKVRYYDTCYRWEVCIELGENIERELEEWKNDLKKLFEQFEIYMIYHNVFRV